MYFVLKATLHGGLKWVPAQIVQISTNRIARNCYNGPKGFTLGPNPNFFTSHMAVYVVQIWRQNFGPKQGKWAKVFLGPNYKTWAHMRLGTKMGQSALQ